MTIAELTISGYRSIKNIALPLERLNVLVGANGVGKSNLYQAVSLLHAAVRGELARTLAAEGGMPSVLWAGGRKKGPVRLSLGVTLDNSLAYELVCGLPEMNDLPPSFRLDPLVKSETVTFSAPGQARVTLLERGKSGADLRDADGRRVSLPMTLGRSESVLSQIAHPHRFPHLSVLRETLSNWRFYHGFRTDAAASLRQPQVGCFTPVLAHSGNDLAAALQTIVELGNADELAQALRQGLGDATLSVLYPTPDNPGERFRMRLETPGVARPLEAWELSDGTLRYLCLLAALLSPRPPALLALNEPETGLHPDLLASLASLIVVASQRSQLWITTHSLALAEQIERLSGVSPITLIKRDGETIALR